MKKDTAKKKLEEYNDVYADIFNGLLFEGEKVLREEYLLSLPTESFTRNMDGSLRQGNRDIRKADGRGGRYRLILGEENQEKRENTMPQRIMGYEYAAYEEQIRTLTDKNKTEGIPAVTKRIHDDQKLAPVITIVLYWGDEEWTRPLHLHDMLEFPSDIEKQIKPFVADYPVNLIQMTRLSAEVRERFTSDFEILADYFAMKNEPEKLKEFMKNKRKVIRHTEEFLDVMNTITGDKRYQQIEKQLIGKIDKEEVTMCTLLDLCENTGIEKGIQVGIQTGIKTGIQTVAKNMFLRGMSQEDTAALCGESTEKIREWFEEWSQ